MFFLSLFFFIEPGIFFYRKLPTRGFTRGRFPSAQIDIVAYGKEAEKIIGLGKEDLKKQRSERGSESMIDELQELSGTKIKVVGKVKHNTYSEQTEFVAGLVELE